MDLEKCRYVVVEGPIGARKTSLARQLADHLAAEVLLEQPEDNPFLARFYDDMARFALPTQLTFLFQRADDAYVSPAARGTAAQCKPHAWAVRRSHAPALRAASPSSMS